MQTNKETSPAYDKSAKECNILNKKIDEENNYSVKLKYCPGMRRNVVIKTDNGSNNETCMDKSMCTGLDNCSHGYNDGTEH